MSRPKFVQTKTTSLKIGISETETTEIILSSLTDIYGNQVSITDYQGILHLTFNPGGENEEIISATGFTVNSNGSVALNAGITRGLSAFAPYTTGGTAHAHAGGTVVVISDNPQIYERILDYIDEVAIAGGANATESSAGFVELPITAEIDSDEEDGSVAPLAITPARLAASKYGTRLPSASAKVFLNATTGMLVPYAGSSAPTGFLQCDGSSVANDTYPELAVVLLGKFGLGTGVTFTADNTNETFTAVSHGLDNGDMVFVSATTTLPAGLSANTPYYVVNKTTNTFQLSTSVGGAVSAITTNGTGTLSFYQSFKVPDLRGSTPIGQGQKTIISTFLDANVDTATDIITVESNDYLHTGQSIALTTSGVLPAGLSATTYYIIRVSATTIKLATSVALANAGTAVNITSAAGGGIHTMTITMTSRLLGGEGGSEYTAEVGAHTHVISGNVEAVSNPQISMRGNATNTSVNSGSAGGNTPNNMPPYVVLNWIIKT